MCLLVLHRNIVFQVSQLLSLNKNEVAFLAPILLFFWWSITVFSSRERLCPKENGMFLPNGRLLEMEPLTELPSNDDLASNNGVESWLETSSKYHSCEVVDN
jgi:hypothetical protein